MYHRWHYEFRAWVPILLYLPRFDLPKATGAWRRVQPIY